MASRPQRWAMGAGVSASLIALITGVFVWQGPSSPPPVARPAPPALGAQASPAASDAVPTSAMTAPAPIASAPSGPAALPQATPTPVVGSEGYGPRILQAIDGTSADEAFWAARRMRECLEAGWNEEALKMGARHTMNAKQVQAAIESDRAETRRCQTVTPDLMAQRAALAGRAAQAGVLNASWEWSDALGASYRQAPPREHLPALREALLADAARCSRRASSLIALSDPAWGFSDADRGLHLRANQGMGGMEASPRLVMRFNGAYRPELQSLPGVEEAAQDYLARCAGSWEKLD